MKATSANLPLSSCGLDLLRRKVIRAFRCGKRLKQSLSRAFLRAFGSVTPGHAWKIVKDYAYGRLTVVGNDLNLLIASWIKLGNSSFRRMVQVVEAFKSETGQANASFEGFLAKVKCILPTRRLSKIESEIRAIWDNLSTEVSLAA